MDVLDRMQHELHEITRAIHELVSAIVLKPKRVIRLQLVEVRFVRPHERHNPMADNIGVDIPQGLIARMVFAPKDQNGVSAKLDGPITAVIQGDPASAQVAIGPDGLTLDIKLPNVTVGETATVEVDGDANLDPSKADVITTLVTARTVAAAVPEAVTLGATAANITFPTADQFGVFPAGPAAKAAAKK